MIRPATCIFSMPSLEDAKPSFWRLKVRVRKKRLHRIARDFIKRLRRARDLHNGPEVRARYARWLADDFEQSEPLHGPVSERVDAQSKEGK